MRDLFLRILHAAVMNILNFFLSLQHAVGLKLINCLPEILLRNIYLFAHFSMVCKEESSYKRK